MKEFLISGRQEGQRADKYLKKILPYASDGFLYKMMRKKNIDLNGRKMTGREILGSGDRIRIWFSDETFQKFSGKEIETESPDQALSNETVSGNTGKGCEAGSSGLTGGKAGQEPEIIYEDDALLILSKPSGMLSQKAKPEDYSVNEWIREYLRESGQFTEQDFYDFTPAVCNRLDRNTSGLILAGKTVRALQEWSRLLKERTLEKYYRCMTSGAFQQDASRVCGWLVKDGRSNRVSVSKKEMPGAARIETEYRVISRWKDVTELEVHLITGKSHQIRAHLASLGHPILGDPKYGDPAVNRHWRQAAGIRSQMLHAYRIRMPDGRSFQAPLPEEFEAVRQKLSSAASGGV